MNRVKLVLPQSLEEVTPSWIQDALSPILDGTTIERVEVRAVTHGSTCRARLNLTFGGDGPFPLPQSLLLKASFSEGYAEYGDEATFWLDTLKTLNGAEVRFYDHGHGVEIMRDRIAYCYFAAQDESGTSTLLLEDLNDRESISFGQFDKPFDENKMAMVLECLAKLHAARWNDPELVQNPLVDGFVGGSLDAFLSQENWDDQFSRPRGARLPRELSDHDLVEKAVRRIWAERQTNPVCLIHGDPHIGNTFFDAKGAGLYDWQLFSSGHWAWDVVYSTAGAMTTEDRRKHEQDLLHHYLEALASNGAAAPDYDSAWLSYRKFAMWGFVAFLTPGEGVQTEEYNGVVGERHAIAALDLESISLLGL